MKNAFFLIFALSCGVCFAIPSPRLEYFRARAAASLNGTVKKAEKRDRQLGVIELFYAMHNLLEANQHFEKLDVLFDLAVEMQDCVPESRSYGNFRWYFRDGYVMDYNAVDFCMQPGSVIARDHLSKLNSEQRKKFDSLLERAIAGCLSHRVRASYTNIAIMNAVNLILLGEACNRPDVFAEGVKRLDDFTLATALFGVCEYSSPTYTGVDIVNLHRLHALAKDPRVKAHAERLLTLFWTDICASSFKGAGRLGGAHSRDYDYLYGMGQVAQLLRIAGVAAPLPGNRTESLPFELVLSDWRPSAAITGLADQTPRFIASRWGEEASQYRTCWIGRNISLGIAGANYWNMDIPLAVDFVSPTRQARGYFIADGRRDPYGTKKIPEGQGPHQKTLHLKPFWGGTQHDCDALGLVVYRADDVPPETPTLESHFVFPSDVDEIFVNDERVNFRTGQPFARPLKAGDAIFVRQGAGAFGLRVPWSRNLVGETAPMALVWDDIPDTAACRLSVAHHDFWGRDLNPDNPPGAAFWIRVADTAADPAAFASFRKTFCSSAAQAEASPAHVNLKVPANGQFLELAARAPFEDLTCARPAPRGEAVFVLNDRDFGTEILGPVPGLAEYRAEMERMKKELESNRIVVSRLHAASWEAEKGVVIPNFEIATDKRASGGKFIWAPGEPGKHGGGNGLASWQLDVKEAGTYVLWGRVNTLTPEDDSFIVSVNKGPFKPKGAKGKVLVPRTDWHVGQTKGTWNWVRFPGELKLPSGSTVLNVHVREDGAKLDRLFLTSDPLQEP